MVVFNGELEGFGSNRNDEGLGEFGEFLGLLGEGGGAVDDVGCALCVPGGGCGEVAVGDTDEGTYPQCQSERNVFAVCQLV